MSGAFLPIFQKESFSQRIISALPIPTINSVKILSAYSLGGTNLIITGTNLISSIPIISNLSVNGTTWTATTQGPHGLASGTVTIKGISGFATNSNLNGSRSITVTGPTTFTFTQGGSPGTGSYLGSSGLIELVGDGKPTVSFTQGSRVLNGKVISSFSDSVIVRIPNFSIKITGASGSGTTITVPSTNGLVAGMEVTTIGTQVSNVTGVFLPGTIIQTVGGTSFTVNTAPSVPLSGATITAFNPSASITVTTSAGSSNSFLFNFFPNNYVDSNSVYDPDKDPAIAIAALNPGDIWDGGGGIYFTKGIEINQPCTVQNATIINPDYWIKLQPDESGTSAPSFAITAFTISSTSLGTNIWSNTATVTIDNSLGYIPGFNQDNIIRIDGITTEFNNITLINDDHKIISVSSGTTTQSIVFTFISTTQTTTNTTFTPKSTILLSTSLKVLLFEGPNPPAGMKPGLIVVGNGLPGKSRTSVKSLSTYSHNGSLLGLQTYCAVELTTEASMTSIQIAVSQTYFTTPVPSGSRFVNGSFFIRGLQACNIPDGVYVGTVASNTLKITGLTGAVLPNGFDVTTASIYQIPPTPNNVNSYSFYVDSINSIILAKCKNNNTIFDYGLPPQNGRIDSAVSGIGGTDTVFNKNIRSSKIHHITWSPYDPSVIFDPDISETDLWSTVRGKYVPDGAYVGSVNTTSKSFTLVNSGGGPLALEDVYDLPTIDSPFTIYIGGDQGALVVDVLGTPQNTITAPIVDPHITSSDIGALVIGIALPPVGTAAGACNLNIGYINQISGGSFTVISANGKAINSTGAVYQVSIGGTIHASITGAANSSIITDDLITSGDLGKPVISNTTSSKGLLLGYVGPIILGNGTSSTTFTLVSTSMGTTPVTIAKPLTSIIVGGRIDGSSNDSSSEVKSTSTNFLSCPTITSGDSGKLVRGINIPFPSYVGTPTNGSGFYLVDKNGNPVIANGALSQIYVLSEKFPLGSYIGEINSSNSSFKLVDSNQNPVYLLADINNTNGTSIMVGPSQSHINIYNINAYGNSFASYYFYKTVGGYGFNLVAVDSVYVNSCRSRFVNGDCLAVFLAQGANSNFSQCSNIHVNTFWGDNAGRCIMSVGAIDNRVDYNVFADITINTNSGLASFDFESDLPFVGVGYLDFIRGKFKDGFHLITSVLGPMNLIDCDTSGAIWYYDSLATFKTKIIGGNYAPGISGSGIYAAGAIRIIGGDIEFKNVKIYRNKNYYKITAANGANSTQSSLGGFAENIIFKNSGADTFHNFIMQPGYRLDFKATLDNNTPNVYDPDISQALVDSWDPANPTPVYTALDFIPQIPNGGLISNDVLTQTPAIPPTSDSTTYVNSVKILSLENTNNNTWIAKTGKSHTFMAGTSVYITDASSTTTGTNTASSVNFNGLCNIISVPSNDSFTFNVSNSINSGPYSGTNTLPLANAKIPVSKSTLAIQPVIQPSFENPVTLPLWYETQNGGWAGIGLGKNITDSTGASITPFYQVATVPYAFISSVSTVGQTTNSVLLTFSTPQLSGFINVGNLVHISGLFKTAKIPDMTYAVTAITVSSTNTNIFSFNIAYPNALSVNGTSGYVVVGNSITTAGPITISNIVATTGVANTWTVTTAVSHGLSSGPAAIRNVTGFTNNNNINGIRVINTSTVPTKFNVTLNPSPGTNNYVVNSGKLNGILINDIKTGDAVSGANIPIGSYVGTNINNDGTYITSFNLVDANANPIVPNGPISTIYFDNFYNFFATNYPNTASTATIQTTNARFSNVPYMVGPKKVHNVTGNSSSSIILDSSIVDNAVHKVIGDSSSSKIYDPAITISHQGHYVTGLNIPDYSYVGPVNLNDTLGGVTTPSFILIDNTSAQANVLPLGKLDIISIAGDTGTMVSGSGIPVNSYVGTINFDPNTKNPVSFNLVDYDGFSTRPVSSLGSITIGGGMIAGELQVGVKSSGTTAEAPSLHKNISGFSVITNKRSINVYKNTITLTASSVISTTNPYIIGVPDITQIYTGQGVTGVGITNSTPGQTGVATVISVNPTNNQVTLKPGLGNTIGTLTQSSYSFIDIVDASISKGNAREVHANYKTGGSVTVTGVVVDNPNNQIALTVNNVANIGLGSTMSSVGNTAMNAAPIIGIDATNNIVYVQISYKKTTINSQQVKTTTNFTAITDVSLITTDLQYNVASNWDGMIMDSFITIQDVGSIVSSVDLPSAVAGLSDPTIDTVNITTAPNCNSFVIKDADGNIVLPTGPTLQIFIGGRIDSVTTSVNAITGKWNNVITDLNLNSGIVHNLTVTVGSSQVLDTFIDSTDEGSLIWVSPNGPFNSDYDLTDTGNNNLSLQSSVTDLNGNPEIIPIIPSVEYVKTWNNAGKPLSNWDNVYVGPVDPGVSFIMVDSNGIPVEPNLSAITDIATNQGLFTDGIVPITVIIGGDMYKNVADFETVIPDPAFVKMNPLDSSGLISGVTEFTLVDVNYNDILITNAITKVAIGARIDNFYGNINDTKIYDSSVTPQDIGSKIQGPNIPVGAFIGKPLVSNSYFTLIDHSNLNLHLINNVNSAVVADDTGALVSSDYTDAGTFVGTIRTDLDPPRFAPVFYNGDASLPKDNLTSVIIGGRSDTVSSANGNSFIVDGAVSIGRTDQVSLVNKSNGMLINNGSPINIATMTQTTTNYNVTITPTTSLGPVNATNYPWIASDVVYISGVSAWNGNTVWQYAIPDGYYSIVAPSAGTFKISTTRQITPVWVSNNPTGSSTLKITSADAALITTSYTILELTASAITNISNVDADGNCTITLNQNYTLSSSIAYYTFAPPLPVSNLSYTLPTLNPPYIIPATNIISDANITVADKGKTALLLSGTDPNGSQPSSYTDAYRVATPITTTLQAVVSSVSVSSASIITLTVQAWPVISGVSTPFVAGTRVLISSDIKNGATTILSSGFYHNITTVSGTTFTISDVTGLSTQSVNLASPVTVTVAGSFTLQNKYGANVNLKSLPSNFYVQIGSDGNLQVIDRDSYLLDVSYPSRPVYVGTITGNGFNLVNNNQQSIPAQGAISSLMVLSGRSDSGAYSPFLLASGKSLSLNNGASTAIIDLTNYGTTYMVNPHPSIAGDAGQLISGSGIPYGTTIVSVKTSATTTNTSAGSPIGYANTYVLALSGINISKIERGITSGQNTPVTITASGSWVTNKTVRIYGLGKYGIPDSNYSISSVLAPGSFTILVHLSSDAALPSGQTSVSGLIPALNITKIANVVVYGSSWKVDLYLNDIGVPWAVNQAVYIRGLSSKNIPDGLYTITATGFTAAPSSPVGNYFTITVGALPTASNNVTGFVTVGMGFWDTTSTDWLVKNKVNVGGRIDSFGNDGTSSTILDTQITTGDTGSTVWIANMPNVIGPDAYYFVGNVTSGMIGVSFPLVDGSGNPVIPKNSFSGMLVGGRNDGVKVSFGSNNPTIVYDTKIKTSDAGSLVTGPYIPANSFVGTVTYPSFALVDGNGDSISLSQSLTNINITTGKTYIKDKHITLKDKGSYVTGKNIPSNGSYIIGKVVNRFELLDSNNLIPVSPLGKVSKSYLYNPSTHFTRDDNISIIEDNRVDKVTWTYLTHSINDTNISIYDFGKYVNGKNIPANSYVGPVTPGVSFILVNSAGTPVGPNFNITIGFNIIIGSEASNIIANVNSVASDKGSIITGYNIPGRTDTVTWPKVGNILNKAIVPTDVGLPVAQINIPINALSIIPGGIFLAQSASSPNNGPFVLTFYDISSIKVGQPVTGPGITGHASVSAVDPVYGSVTLTGTISVGGLSTSVYNFVGAKVGTVNTGSSFTLVDMLDQPITSLNDSYSSNTFDIAIGYSTVGEVNGSFELLDANRNSVYFDSYNHSNDIDLWIDNNSRAIFSYNYTTDDLIKGYVILHEVSYRGVQSPELRQLRNGGPIINDPTNVPPMGGLLPVLGPNLWANTGTQGAILVFTDCIFDESAGPSGYTSITKFGAIAANDPSSVIIQQSVTKITVPVITITGVAITSSIATLTGTIPSVFDINYWNLINRIYIKGLSTYNIPDDYYTIATGSVSLISLTVTFNLSDIIATADATNTGISNATGIAVMLNSIGNWPINTAISISGLQTTTPATSIPDGDYTIDSSARFNLVATDASSTPGGAHTLTFSDISNISLDQIVIGMGIVGYARIGSITPGTTVNGITPGVVSLIGDKIRYLLPNSYKFISGFFVVPLNTAAINLSSVRTTSNVNGNVVALQAATGNAASSTTNTSVALAAITSISPAGAQANSATTITINGSSFSGTTSVLFGNTPAASFAVVSDTQITAVTPSLPTQVTNVTVTNAIGSSSPSVTSKFTHINSESSSTGAFGSWAPVLGSKSANVYDVANKKTAYNNIIQSGAPNIVINNINNNPTNYSVTDFYGNIVASGAIPSAPTITGPVDQVTASAPFSASYTSTFTNLPTVLAIDNKVGTFSLPNQTPANYTGGAIGQNSWIIYLANPPVQDGLLGQNLSITLSGFTPSGYNGTYSCYFASPTTIVVTNQTALAPVSVVGTATVTLFVGFVNQLSVNLTLSGSTPSIGDTIVITYAMGAGARAGGMILPTPGQCGVSHWSHVVTPGDQGYGTGIIVGTVDQSTSSKTATITVAGNSQQSGFAATLSRWSNLSIGDVVSYSGTRTLGTASTFTDLNNFATTGNGEVIIGVIGSGSTINNPVGFTSFTGLPANNISGANQLNYAAGYFQQTFTGPVNPSGTIGYGHTSGNYMPLSYVSLVPAVGGSTLTIPAPNQSTGWAPGYYYVSFTVPGIGANGCVWGDEVDKATVLVSRPTISGLPNAIALPSANVDKTYADPYMHGFNAIGPNRWSITYGSGATVSLGQIYNNGQGGLSDIQYYFDQSNGNLAAKNKTEPSSLYFDPSYADANRKRSALVNFPNDSPAAISIDPSPQLNSGPTGTYTFSYNGGNPSTVPIPWNAISYTTFYTGSTNTISNINTSGNLTLNATNDYFSTASSTPTKGFIQDSTGNWHSFTWTGNTTSTNTLTGVTISGTGSLTINAYANVMYSDVVAGLLSTQGFPTNGFSAIWGIYQYGMNILATDAMTGVLTVNPNSIIGQSISIKSTYVIAAVPGVNPSGTFTLSYTDASNAVRTSAPIAYNASAATVLSAVQAMSGLSGASLGGFNGSPAYTGGLGQYDFIFLKLPVGTKSLTMDATSLVNVNAYCLDKEKAYQNQVAAVSSVLTAYNSGSGNDYTWYEGKNEPDQSGATAYNSGLTAYAIQYAQLRAALKTGNTNAKAMGPSFSSSLPNGSAIPGTNPNSWLNIWIAAVRNAGQDIDGVSLHLYNSFSGDFAVLENNLADIRARLASFPSPSIANVPIWCTEAGSFRLSYGAPSVSPYHGSVFIDYRKILNVLTTLYLAGERYGMPKENICIYYDIAHGDPFYSPFSSNGDLYPHHAFYRTYSDELFGKTWYSSNVTGPTKAALSCGTIGNNFYRIDVFHGTGGTTVVLTAQGIPSDTITLNVPDTGTITYSDFQGKTSTVTASGGHITIPISDLPTYVRLAATSYNNITVADVGNGVKAGTDLTQIAGTTASSGAISGTLTTTYPASFAIDNNYRTGGYLSLAGNPDYAFSVNSGNDTIDAYFQISWTTQQSINQVIIRQLPPNTDIGPASAMTIGTLQYLPIGSTVWTNCPTVPENHWDSAGNYNNTTATSSPSAIGQPTKNAGTNDTVSTYVSFYDDNWIHHVRMNGAINTLHLRLLVTGVTYGNFPDAASNALHDQLNAYLRISEFVVI